MSCDTVTVIHSQFHVYLRYFAFPPQSSLLPDQTEFLGAQGDFPWSQGTALMAECPSSHGRAQEALPGHQCPPKGDVLPAAPQQNPLVAL